MGKRGPKPLPAPKWGEQFCEALRVTGSVSAAAKSVNRCRRSVYKWADKSARFARNMEDAWESVRDELEGSAMRRAIHGWNEPIYFRGEKVGDRRVFSPGLTIFMLKCHRPQKYNVQHETAKSATAMEHARSIRETLASIESAMAGDLDLPERTDADGGELG